MFVPLCNYAASCWLSCGLFFYLSITSIPLLVISGLQMTSYTALISAELLLCCGHYSQRVSWLDKAWPLLRGQGNSPIPCCCGSMKFYS